MGFIFSIIIAYLLGSLSCAILTAKFLNLPDPRTQGSGNAGATNVLRSNGTKAGIIVLVGDLVKGVIAVAIGIWLNQSGIALGFVALAAVVGHVFPVYFGFKGGKGVATAAGTLLVISFWTCIFVLLTWALILFFTRYVSLASIIGAIAAPIYLLVGGNFIYFLPFLIIAALIVWKHMDNINRLRSGSENKIKFS